MYKQLEVVEEGGEPARSLPDPIQEARPGDHARVVARDAVKEEGTHDARADRGEPRARVCPGLRNRAGRIHRAQPQERRGLVEPMAEEICEA